MEEISQSCRHCGYTNRPGKRYCSGCGSSLAPVCPACGTENEAEARFCDECGSLLRITGEILVSAIGRRRIEAALRSSELRHRLLFERIASALAVCAAILPFRAAATKASVVTAILQRLQ